MLWKIETHCHSIYSHDCLVSIDKLIQTARKRGLARLILTDHNTIAGAQEAKKRAPDLIIIGEEIMTTRGELLAFFVNEEIPAGLEPMEAINRLRAQNAFISVSHPYDRLRHGWALSDLQAITPYIDAVEIFNARSFTKTINEQAVTYAKDHQLNGTAGSDAHTIQEIGRAVLQIPPFDGVEEFSTVVKQAIPLTRYSSPLVRFGSTYAKWIKRINKIFKPNPL